MAEAVSSTAVRMTTTAETTGASKADMAMTIRTAGTKELKEITAVVNNSPAEETIMKVRAADMVMKADADTIKNKKAGIRAVKGVNLAKRDVTTSQAGIIMVVASKVR